MSLRTKLNLTAVTLVAALLSTAVLAPSSFAAVAAQGGRGITAPITGDLKNEAGNTVGKFTGEIEITGLKLDQNKKLLVSGEIRGKADVPGQQNNREIKQAFTDKEASLLLGDRRAQMVEDGAEQSYRVIPDQAGAATEAQQGQTCDLLTLLIPGGIFLDLLGLQLFIAPILIFLNAVSGAGNLLGNLLCALAGLLDPQA